MPKRQPLQATNNLGPTVLIQSATPETVEAARRAVVDVLNTPAADAAKVAGLNALSSICHVSGSIHGCHLTGPCVNQTADKPIA